MAVTDEAIEKIKEMIVSGVLKPGDRLPKEDLLAEELGLSRSSLREAVRALALVRVLVVRQGDGTYVTSLDSRLLLDAVSFVVDFHRDDSVLFFLEVRRIIEPAAAAIAARRVTDQQVQALRDILAKISPVSSVEELVANDLAFHRAIAEYCQNPVLVSLIDSMSIPTTRARVWRGLTQEDAVRRTITEHHGIVDALARREPEVAAARCAVHIAAVEDWLRQATS